MLTNNTLTFLQKNDIEEIVAAFKFMGWNKPASTFEAYLKDQEEGQRYVIVAKQNGLFCGYVTMKLKSEYAYFCSNKIPEISDLNVLPRYRKKGIGTNLIKFCEAKAGDMGCSQIGIGVGMTADYGNAQRLYPSLGYLPDGNGLHYKNKIVSYGDKVDVDDDLVLYFIKSIKNPD